MKNPLLLCLSAVAMSLTSLSAIADSPVVLVIHGGAGVVRAEMTPAKEKAARAGLELALKSGYAVLKDGGTSLDAVSKSITVLEDDPNFNAGRGAVFNHDGKNEMDAALMEGHTLRAGAVAGVHRIKNPILLARAVMEKSVHVMLTGDGAEVFAKSIGMALVDPSYFRTEERWKQLQDELKAEAAKTHAAAAAPHFGTVGAVALDHAGHLAAGTSTGGMTNKRWGRVGDSPIIGAGTYANDKCAVSGTGWGEFYIRTVAAHEICARVAYRGDAIGKAADDVILNLIPKLGGDGGAIALDAQGNYATPFNTDGMFRGWVDRDGTTHIAIYKE